MTRHDAFEADLFAVFDDAAQAPIPAGALDQLNAAILDRQPRPARLAGLGGHWVADPSAATSPLGGLRVTVPVLRLSATMLLLLLALALIGAAALVGGRLLEPQPELERLLYELDGDIYLADADGRNPIRVAEGAVLLELSSSWAPDGRHFVSFDTTRLTVDIRDPDGHVVTSSVGETVWSPDSTRLQGWGGERQINIYGIDGVLQAELPLPDGYTRYGETLGVWAPDGRSIWVLIDQGQTFPCTLGSPGAITDQDAPPCAAREVWELPIDRSAPRRVAEGSPFIPWPPNFTRDGTRMAFSRSDGSMYRLYVANADGTEARMLQDRSGSNPAWSPNGEELAYLGEDSGAQGNWDYLTVDLKVVDVATGTDRTLVTGWPPGSWPLYSWSPDGDRIMFSKQDGATPDSLWSVGAEGGEPTLLVEGATRGEWQPAAPTAAP